MKEFDPEVMARVRAMFEPSDEEKARLAEAEEAARQQKLLAGMGQAGSTIGAAISGIKADGSFYDQLRADADAQLKGAQAGVANDQEKRIAIAQFLEKKRGEDAERALAETQHKEKMGHEDRKIKVAEKNAETDRLFASSRIEADSAKLAAKEAPKNYEQRLKTLNGEQLKRHDNISLAMESLQDMQAAMADGDWTFSLYGDNRFTTAAKAWEEAIGRMQSGGAINEEEAKRFRGMVPGPMDSEEVQQLKLRKMMTEIANRGRGLGFEPEEMLSYRQSSRGQVPGLLGPGPGSNDKLFSGTALAGGRVPVKKLYSQSRNKTRLIYEDGTEEVVDGRR